MSVLDVICVALVALLFLYLFVALLRPESLE
jgi:K+-transporting ATPase KdpF subunit